MDQERRPIFLTAETGFIIRNLLLGTFAEAVTQYKPLVVAVQNPRDKRLLDVVENTKLTLVPLLRERNRTPASRLRKLATWQTYMYRFKQGSKTTEGIEIIKRIENSQHSFVGKTGARFLNGLGRLLNRTGIMSLVEDRYQADVSRWPITGQWCQLLTRLKPSAVISTMLTLSSKDSQSNDLPMVVAAHKLGIPCGTLIQSWDNLTSKTAALPHWLDRYWTWSESMSAQLLALYPRISPERVIAVGSPQFDFHLRPDLLEPRESHLKQIGLDPQRPFILIGTVTSTSFPNEPQTVLQLVEVLHDTFPTIQALIRLHPKDDGSRWAALRDRLEAYGAVIQETAPPIHMDSGGFIPPKEFYRKQVNSLAHASVVINSASTLTVDAAILDRPVICLGYEAIPDPQFPEGRAWAFSQSSHYAPLVATGGVTVVGSLEECIRSVCCYLEQPSLNREGRRRIVEIVAGKVEGLAGERLAEEVRALANRPVLGVSLVNKRSGTREI